MAVLSATIEHILFHLRSFRQFIRTVKIFRNLTARIQSLSVGVFDNEQIMLPSRSFRQSIRTVKFFWKLSARIQLLSVGVFDNVSADFVTLPYLQIIHLNFDFFGSSQQGDNCCLSVESITQIDVHN